MSAALDSVKERVEVPWRPSKTDDLTAATPAAPETSSEADKSTESDGEVDTAPSTATAEIITSAASAAPASSDPSPPPEDSTAAAESDTDAEPFTPYTDDPEAGYTNEEMLQMQQQMMNDQDVHLDRLSQSINRQRDLSLQINDELDVHTGLLEELDHELDHTGSRLSRARRGLDRVAKGAKDNGAS